MKNYLLLLLIAVFSCSINTLPDAGICDRDDSAELQSLIEHYVSEGIPGITVLVNDPVNGMYTGSAGYSDLSAKTPMNNDISRIGSITKVFTSALIMQLAEESLLCIDSLASKYLPDSIVATVDNLDAVTVKQLLNHTSGISAYTESMLFGLTMLNDKEKIWDCASTLKCIEIEKAYFEPGTDFHYSNTNYILLGMIIENVTGDSYEHALYQRIIEPYALDNTYFSSTEPVPAGICRGYADMINDGKLVDATIFTMGQTTPDGGIVSSAADLDAFIRGIANGIIIDAASFDMMSDWYVTEDENSDYGLGLTQWQTIYGNAVGHSGSMFGYCAEMYYFPDSDLSVIILANGYGNSIFECIDSVKTGMLDVIFE